MVSLLRQKAMKERKGGVHPSPVTSQARSTERAALAKTARNSNVAPKINTRTAHEAALAALACKLTFKSAQVSTTTARLKVSTRPCSGRLALIAAGLLTAAS